MSSMNEESKATNSTPADQGSVLSDQVSAEADAAMRGAMSAPERAKPAEKPSGDRAGKPSAIRGPRVVQAGREHRTGKVVSVGPTDIFIEFGPKELGILPRLQYGEDPVPAAGEEVQVVIDRFEASESLFICSRPGTVQKADWEMLEAGTVLEAKVTGVVQGKDGKQAGLELEVAKHRAFMPISQVSIDRIPDLSIFVGEKVKCSVVRVERAGKGNIILSRRDVLDADRKEQAEKLKATLVEGVTVEGTVRKIMPFGAFVDIGGVDGLVHVSDISHDRMGFGEKAVAKHLTEGQRVKVKILKIDHENNRISLGLKQTMDDPFSTAVNAIQEGAEVGGKVVRLAEFGAFIEIAPGVDGLVHISEIDHKRIGKVEDALKIDEIIRAKILKIDPGTRRISLSIKALKPLPEVAIGSGGGGGGGGKGGPTAGGGDSGGYGPMGSKPGRGGKDKIKGPSAEEILKETPALRRAREKFKKFQFKGGM
jgi:small subunit ribosomal protein S1